MCKSFTDVVNLNTFCMQSTADLYLSQVTFETSRELVVFGGGGGFGGCVQICPVFYRSTVSSVITLPLLKKHTEHFSLSIFLQSKKCPSCWRLFLCVSLSLSHPLSHIHTHTQKGRSVPNHRLGWRLVCMCMCVCECNFTSSSDHKNDYCNILPVEWTLMKQ